MPRGHKDSSSLAAEIKMMRMVHSGSFLLVEGVRDVKFWRMRRYDTCELVDAEGKPNVIAAVFRLDSEEFSGVLGIVDDDFDSLLGISNTWPNLVSTDAHDLECILCRSSALESVLAEFGNAKKIQRFEEAAGVDVRTSLLERTTVFGRLRWATKLYGLDIDVNTIRIPRFIDIDTWSVDSDELVRVVSGGGTRYDSDDLKHRIDELPFADPWRVAHGRDMIQILRMGLMHVLGALPANKGAEDIARVLRAAMPLDELQRTTFYAHIRNWERANGFLVLRN